MGNSIYLGGGIKSAFCGGNVKEIWQGTNKLFPSGGGGLVYETNFVNLDLESGVDIPKFGKNRNWSNFSGISKTTATYDNVEYNVLRVGYGSNFHLVDNLESEFPNGFSVEATIRKVYTGNENRSPCSLLYKTLNIYDYVGSPSLDFYWRSWGIGVCMAKSMLGTIFSNAKSYNEFSYIGSNGSSELYESNYYDKGNDVRFVSGGFTIIPNGERKVIAKTYLEEKKAYSWDWESGVDNGRFVSFCTNGGGQNPTFDVISLKIYDYDRFEEME